MQTISITEAERHFKDLLHRAEAGEEVVITRRGKPILRLAAIAPVLKEKKPLTEVEKLERTIAQIGAEKRKPKPPVAKRLTLAELDAFLASLPKLDEEDSLAFEQEINEFRRQLPPLDNPWK